MKFVLAAHGTRGDVEPCAAVGLELVRRQHKVCMAVPPNLVGFVESVGLAGVPFGPDSQETVNAQTNFVRQLSQLQSPGNLVHATKELFVRGWADMSRTLMSLAGDADLLFTGLNYHGVAANIAEYFDIPLGVLHYFPVRPNGRVALPSVPLVPPLIGSTMRTAWWVYWRMTKEAEDTQRRELGLPKAAHCAAQRIEQGGHLEIQGYDQVCFPGLAKEWAGRRPFVGALTMELQTEDDDDVASWIAAGPPPIYFGFGSLPVESPAETFAMTSELCAELGERALICSGWADFDRIPHYDHVKAVRAVNHSTIFPACRAVVHHGGAGTTAAGVRAGVPSLILWDVADAPIWGAQVKRLKIGSTRRFTTINRKILGAELRSILTPAYVSQARAIADRMTKPADSIASAADLLEEHARGASLRGFGTSAAQSRAPR
jgi:UDP:flavonoid glycosyltransferase YjiC (YdhE family)